MHNYSGTTLQDTVKPPNKGDGPFVSCREVVLFSEVSLKPIEKFLKTQKKHLKSLKCIIGASLSEPHTSVTVMRTRVSIRPTMDRTLTENFKSADLRNF